jgi:hypothetical protein
VHEGFRVWAGYQAGDYKGINVSLGENDVDARVLANPISINTDRAV